MKIYIFILILYIGASTLHGQNKAETLLQSFNEAENDSLKMANFQNLYIYHLTRDLRKAEKLNAKLDSLCIELATDECEGLNHFLHGLFYRVRGAYDTSLVRLNLALSKYKILENDVKIARCLFNIGVVTSYKGDNFGAVEKYMEAKPYYERTNNIGGLTNIYNSIGIIYKELEEFDKAYDNYKKAEMLADSSNNMNMIALISNNLANFFYEKERNPDSVIVFANKALEIEKKLGRNTGIARAYNLLCAAYSEKNELSKSLEYCKKSLEVSELTKHNRTIVIHRLALAKLYDKLSQFSLAEKYYIKGIKLADSINYLDFQLIGNKDYAQGLEKIGRYKDALVARKKYEEYKDSVAIEDSRVKIRDLESKYKTALQDKQLEEQKVEINKKTYQRNLFLSGMVLIALLGASLIWGIISRLRRNKKINEQENHIRNQKILNLEKEKKLLSISSMIEGQELERQRIAKDLHDGLGGLLTTVKAHYSKIGEEINKLEQVNVFNRAENMMDQACDEVRRISHNLMPGVLTLQGLVPAIEQLVDESNIGHELEVKFENLIEEANINSNIQIFLFRIIQELVNNVIKHANADHILIQLSETEDQIHLFVEDDGVGFDFSEKMNSSGIGMKSLQSRVDYLSGEIDFDTRPGEGCTVTIHIPKNQSP